MDKVISISGLNKSFAGLKVIDDVSFDVRKSSRTALIGPNGAGKTTVFNLISGVYPIDSGSITMQGRDVSTLPSEQRVSMGISRSFQNIRLMPHLSTVENVMLGQHSRALGLGQQLFPLGLLPRNRWAERAREALATAGLDAYPGQVVADLPYGIQKRIEVVRALMADPTLLLLDEPAASLNYQETEELLKLLGQISNGGVTLLVVEHDMHFVRNLCDHVVVLNFGKKIFEGSPEEVNADPAVREAYLGPDQNMGQSTAAPGQTGASHAT